MPIFLQTFEWSQNEKTLEITLDCPTIFLSKNVTILHSENYLKLSNAPYIFEVFLEANVQVGETRCLFKEQKVYFEFFKLDKIVWKDIQLFQKELRLFQKFAFKRKLSDNSNSQFQQP